MEVELNEIPEKGALLLTASYEGKTVACQEVRATEDRFLQTELYLNHNECLEGIHMWRPGNPALYDLTLETLYAGEICDAVDERPRLAGAGGRQHKQRAVARRRRFELLRIEQFAEISH